MKQRASPYTPEVAAYMQSESWRAKRKARLMIDNYHCRICGTPDSRDNHLQVHHLAHGYKGIPNEPVTDLLTVCERCHNELHRWLRKVRKEWSKK